MTDDYRELRVVCDCNDPVHFIQFDWDKWFDGTDDINLFFCAHRIGGFWRRLYRAFRYVFWSQELVTADICISKEKAREIAEFLNDVGGREDAE